MVSLRHAASAAIGSLCLALGAPALAQTGVADAVPGLNVALSYKADVINVDAGKDDHDTTYLDRLDILGSLDLDRAAGWKGAKISVDVLNSLGGRPNRTARTLQGIDNNAVDAHRLRLFQAWIQQSFAGERGSVLVGRYNLNSEFYRTDAAGQLIGPAFGVGSELASTGPNGPSIFPRTDLAVRARMADGGGRYVQAAVIRAPEGTLAKGGQRSVVFIGQIGTQGSTAISLGAWAYSRQQPRVQPPGVSIAPGFAASHGVYTSIEQDIAGKPDERGYWRAFLRVGLSDGRTTPYGGGLQAGVTGRSLFATRPDSLLSLGFSTVRLTDRYRRGNPAGAAPLGRAEEIVELAYSDRPLHFLTLRPDLQYVWQAGGVRDAHGVVVGGMRAIVDWKLI